MDQNQDNLSTQDLQSAWPVLSLEERLAGFKLLDRLEEEDFFLSLSSADQAQILLALPAPERRSWLRLLPPDEAADLLQQVEPHERDELLNLIDDSTRKEITGLLAYEEDEAGGLMTPRYARIRPDMTVDEAISYVRRQTRQYVPNYQYLYVLDDTQRLLGVVSLLDLLKATTNQTVRAIMATDMVTAHVDQDQNSLSRLFSEYGLSAIPVVDDNGKMQGIITLDDIVDVVQEEATKDIQKLGGTEALDAPYFQMSFLQMMKKRAGWLCVLFLGEMLTASAMSYFEDEIARAVVLALFVPLIISSGGNSGSQATTIIIRSLALGEVRLRDWWRVMKREIFSGIVLGSILAVIGFSRILLWEKMFHIYGEHAHLVAFTVGTSLVGVVLWGTIAGSMLPFLLRRFGVDPANASAPFVATLVDVSGLVIYFTVASMVLRGTLL